MPKKKSPRRSPRKEYISERGQPSNRLYLKKKDVPKVSKLDKFFENIIERKQQIVELDLSNKKLGSSQVFHYYNLRRFLYQQSFQSIKILNLSNTEIFSIDLPNLVNLEVLDLSKNPLNSLYLSKHIQLKKLNISNTKISGLYRENIIKLEELNINNCLFDELILLHLPKLKILECASNKLIEFYCNNCLLLEKINISNNTDLKEIKMIVDCPKINYLDCSSCAFTKLDLNPMLNVKTLICSNNKIDILDCRQLDKLKILECNKNKLVSYDTLLLPKNNTLKKLSCSKNLISHLDIGKEKNLVELVCNDNQIEKLSLNNLKGLTKLNCSVNNLNILNVFQLKNLKILYCRSNQIETLRLLNNGEISELDCAFNKISELDLYTLSKLEKVICHSNKLTRLSIGENNSQIKLINCGQNILNRLDTGHCPNLEILEFGRNNFIDSPDVSLCLKLKEFIGYKNNLTSLDLGKNLNLEELDVNNNFIDKIILPQTDTLENIDVDKNNLSTIDVTPYTKLYSLRFSNNILTEIDLKKNILLEHLDCSDNKLTKLDTDKNVNLRFLDCSDNDIEKIKLDNNRKITLIRAKNNRLSIPMNYVKHPEMQTQKYSEFKINYDISGNTEKHDLYKILFSDQRNAFPFTIQVKDIVPQKLNNCFQNYYASPKIETPIIFLLKAHGLIDKKPHMFQIPEGVNVITLSIAGDVITLSDKVIDTIKTFYMYPKYKIKIPYDCEFKEFISLINAEKYYISKFKDCNLQRKIYKNPIPSFNDLSLFYKFGNITENMKLLRQIGWEFLSIEKPYLFKREDKSHIKTPEAKKLEIFLNDMQKKNLNKWSEEEGRSGEKNIKYNIRNHLSGHKMKDQNLYFFTPDAKCNSNVCSMDMIIDWPKTTPNYKKGRMLYRDCHQFGMFKLSELIAEHGKGTYIVHACRSIKGLHDIESIEESGLRQASFDYDQSYELEEEEEHAELF